MLSLSLQLWVLRWRSMLKLRLWFSKNLKTLDKQNSIKSSKARILYICTPWVTLTVVLVKQNLSLQCDTCNSWTTFPLLWAPSSPLYCREQTGRTRLYCIRQCSSSLSSFFLLFSCAIARMKENVTLTSHPGWNSHNPIFAHGRQGRFSLVF